MNSKVHGLPPIFLHYDTAFQIGDRVGSVHVFSLNLRWCVRTESIMFSEKLGWSGKLYGLWLKAENGGPMLFAKATMLKDGRGVRPIRSLKGSSFLISESPSLVQDTLMSSKDIQRQSFAEIHTGLRTTPEEIGSLKDSMERLIIRDEVEGRKE
ncbi:hypothetical protein FNV43_RR08899 [Rhamnella rubrinervis]|uniref:Uncharacterized protein n=1 Tax=Rhamnella rubrinervis TaxID=2594499 RepID=A0A8K0H918_9ROSA|nr:hypothetical protein FNV43_RR08899 [Rhamnella rubrinervis]